MAARKQLWHPDEVRAKIQASQLINRLHEHAFGKIELTSQQVKSIDILLRKAIPDLSAVELSGKDGGAIAFTVVSGVPRDDD
jgi:hypothetical protein